MDLLSGVHSLQLIMLCRLSKSAPEILWSVRGFLSDSPLQQLAASNPAMEIAKVTLRSWFEHKAQPCRRIARHPIVTRGVARLMLAGIPAERPPGGCREDILGRLFLVLDDFGRIGCAWRETGVESADRETLIRDLVDGQYGKPVRIVAFNTTEGWARDVTVDIADELRRRYVEFGEIPSSILDFMEANRR